LNQWWAQQGDPLLVQLIDAAQAAAPTVASAGSRIAQSRADRTAAGAALLPSLDASASSYRQGQQSTLPTGTTSQAALATAWEIDLFGARRNARDAAQLRLDGAEAGWHDARVAVAAEVATQYYALRACRQLLNVAKMDAASRAATARLTELTASAGFQSPANAARARASAADGNSLATQQRGQCDLDIKALVELTAMPEPLLRQRLDESAAVPAPAITIATLPASTLVQRPDVYTAERNVAAASADVGAARAQRYPRLTLSGNVGTANFQSGGSSTTLKTWTIGPLAVDLPIFDAGTRRANIDAASAAYDSAVVQYGATVRQAVREIEQAMVNLDSAADRSGDAETALQGYRSAYDAIDSSYRNGLASLLDLEDARRTRLAAENAVVNLRNQRDAAWVALYRAAGGGWSAPVPGPGPAAAGATR